MSAHILFSVYDTCMTHYQIATEPPTKGWDIHCHTVFSDGTETPTTLVKMAQDKALMGVGISDHDTTNGWAEAQEAAIVLHLPVLRGTEITAVDNGVSVHMLAFQYNPESEHIGRLFTATRQARMVRTQRMVELIGRDYPITWKDVLQQVKEGESTTIGRPHIADALVAAGVYSNRSQAFAGIVSGISKYYVPTPSPEASEVVLAVRQAGGVSIIAHPGDTKRNRRLLSNEQIEQLADCGLGGLEIWHRGNDQKQRVRLLEIAQKLDLLVTGGSDWHGAGKPNELGENLTDNDTVREIVSRGAIELAGRQ